MNEYIFQINTTDTNICLCGLRPDQVVAMNCADCKCVKILNGFYFYFEACEIHDKIFKKAIDTNVYDAKLELFVRK